MNMVLTQTAADALKGLAPPVRTAVVDFLRERFPGYAKTHEPTMIPGLQGKYWVVSPKGAGSSVRLMVTTKDGHSNGPSDFVVASVLTPLPPAPIQITEFDPKSAQLGSAVLESTVIV
jgi:hypothetical protein